LELQCKNNLRRTVTHHIIPSVIISHKLSQNAEPAYEKLSTPLLLLKGIEDSPNQLLLINLLSANVSTQINCICYLHTQFAINQEMVIRPFPNKLQWTILQQFSQKWTSQQVHPKIRPSNKKQNNTKKQKQALHLKLSRPS